MKLTQFWGPGRFQIDGYSIWKSLRVVLIAIAAFAIEQLAQWLTKTDFGTWRPVIIAAGMALIELARKFLKDYSTPKPPDNDQI